ncbi:MAG: hypothetical protein IJA69_05895, partial [Clostridia bacterium]|nr:hypothetical protein [Clostridia bacterium]
VETKQNTSEEHPWPISTYEELMDMAEDGYYILMKDIILPSDFAPITTKIKSFDGNGYSIKYANVYNYQSIEKFGLFETIEEDCIVKNLTIDIEKTSMFNIDNITADKSIEFGLLASTNNGMIYNCCVKTQTTSSIKVSFDSSSSSGEKSLVAGVCAINNGYITNSQCQIRIETTGVNLAGFVGQNNNHIANSYQSGCNIRNSSTNVNNTTGGFVLYNNGYMSGCYISGASSDENLVKMFSDNTGYIVQSSSIVGAFVYSNDGQIEDCYSNIPVVSSTKNSGFVAINNGEISRVYTTSLLGNNDTDNYPFFITNDGEIKDCAYLQDETSKINTNISVTNKNVEGLSALSIKDFNVSSLQEMQNSAFKNFVVNSNSLQDSSSQIYIQTGVWFFPGDARNVSVSSGYSYKIPYEQFSYMGKAQSFVARRPELVSANLLAYSRKQINEAMTKIDEITGETIYSYTTPADISYASSGTINNPIIITSAAQMEQSLIADPSYAYRLVQDIDYVEEEIIMSNLNKTIFTGHFEGNNLKISNFSINSGDVEVSGGYFAEIGDGSAGNYATVKNLVLCPKYINLPNAFNVGALAGTVNCGNLYNVEVVGYTAGLNSADKKGIVVLGRNIVGGVVGRTVNAFDIKDVCSSVSANATYAYVGEDIYLTDAYLYSELKGNSNSVSYAGSIIGYVGGSGVVDAPQITDNTVSIALVAGMYFGGIGEEATVQNINATITSTANTYIRVSAYGGVVAGDSFGEIKNVAIDYAPTLEEIEINEGKPFFRESPKIPFAVGGAVGYVRGGKLDNVCSNLPIVSQKIYIVGGLVGKMSDAEISNSKIIKYNNPQQQSNEPQEIDTIQLQSVYIVGGIVGQILDAKVSEDSTLYNQSKIT